MGFRTRAVVETPVSRRREGRGVTTSETVRGIVLSLRNTVAGRTIEEPQTTYSLDVDANVGSFEGVLEETDEVWGVEGGVSSRFYRDFIDFF